jgi:cytochrome P450
MLDELAAKHGPTFVVGGGPLTMVIVGDPAHLQQLLTTSVDAFKWGHRYNVLGFVVGPGSMIVSDNDEWRRRRGAAQPGFARRRLDAWIPLMVDETDRSIDTAMSTTAGFDMYPVGRALVRRIVIRVLFGDALGARADEFGDIMEPAMTYAVQPGLRQLPHPLPYTRRARAKQALKAGDEIIYEEIDRRSRESRDDAPDLLDALIEGDTLSRSEIRDQLITLIGAGYDTTSSGIAWTVLRAVTTPGVWERLRAEADRVLGNAPTESFGANTLRELRYADAVVRESLRLHPPGVFSPRQAERDLTLGSLPVKKGSMILWSPYISGRLPELWDDPLEFRPDRFEEPNERQQAAIDGGWMPFGKGPRACIGFALAQMELMLVLARLAQRVDLTVTRPGIPKAVGMVVNRPDGGVVVTARQRVG